MNAGEALGPGSAQEFGKDGLGLIVKGVRGGDGIDLARRHQLAKPAIAEAARRFLDRFRVLRG